MHRRAVFTSSRALALVLLAISAAPALAGHPVAGALDQASGRYAVSEAVQNPLPVGVAPASPGPGPSLAYERWLQAPGAPFSIGNFHSLAGVCAHFAVGDFDGDGLRDVACLEAPLRYYDPGPRVEIWLNQGAARFALRDTLSALPPCAIRLVAVNLDGDSMDDLVLLSSGFVTVFRATGGGNFAPACMVDGFENASSLAVADMDRDGRPDVIVLDDARVTVLAWAAGVLHRALTAEAPTGNEIEVGDFNGDGWLDIAVAGYAMRGVAVLGGGPGSIGPPVIRSANAYYRYLAAGDLDGDGYDDIVAGSWLTSVFWGDGLDPLSLHDDFDNYVHTDEAPVVVADVDGDGLLDFACGRRDFGVAVFRNTGERHFDDATSWFTGTSGDYHPGISPDELACTDLDGDGVNDWLWSIRVEQGPMLASVRGLGGAVYAGMAVYALPGIYTYPGFPSAVAVDFDGKGRPDILVGSRSACWIFRSRDDGGFEPARPFGPHGIPLALHLDPDERINLVLGTADSFYVCRTRPNATLHDPVGYNGGFPVAFVDVNGDGWPDAVQARGDGVFVRFNDGHARFDRVSAGFPATSPVIGLGDLDGDGLADLVLGFTHWDVRRDSLVMFRGLGDGRFEVWQRIALFPDKSPSFHPRIRKVLLADLDADGDNDVVAALGQDGDTGARVDVLVNSGRGSLFPDDSYDIYGEGPNAYLADFTGDGLPDLATLSYTGTGIGRFHMRFNTGVARFDDWAFQYLGPGYPSGLTSGDFNNDGLLDVAYQAHGPGGPYFLVVCYNILAAPAGYRPRRGRLNPPGLHATPETQSAPDPAVRLAIERVIREPQGVSFELSLPTAAPARLDLFDVTGRRVFTRRLDAGPGRLSLRLPREAARASGIYWARLSQDGTRVSRKIALLN